MAKLLKIAKTKDVPPGQAAAFTIEGQKIALFNVEGTYHAIGDTCTHLGGPLSEGDVQGTRVTCPWHGGLGPDSFPGILKKHHAAKSLGCLSEGNPSGYRERPHYIRPKASNRPRDFLNTARLNSCALEPQPLPFGLASHIVHS